MTQSHLSQPALTNPATHTPSAPSSAEPTSLLSTIARILLLRRAASRTEPVPGELPHNDNAVPGVEWALQIMN